MNSSISIVQGVGEPLALFFRPGKHDHNVLKQLLSEGRAGMLGGVFDPCHVDRQEELKHELLARNLDAILDPGMMELATLGGYTPARQRLPWALSKPHTPADFSRSYCNEICERIAAFTAAKKFSAILAPTHYLHEGPKDLWFDVDKMLVMALRERLDANGCKGVIINYPLAIPSSVFLDATSRIRIKAALGGLPIHAIWLRVHPFGGSSAGSSARRYILACAEMHRAGLPLIAEKTGVLALPLLAFGAVTGADCGVSSGEKFDFSRLKAAPRGSDSFRRTARVYVHDLGGFLSRAHAKQLFSTRAYRQYACRDTTCCTGGADAMLKDFRRHFAYSRMVEIDHLSKTPPSLRPNWYLEQILRPATDHIGRVLTNSDLPNDLRTALERSSTRQAGWRATFGEMSRRGLPSISATFERRVQRKAATA
jgi:hypothetical protein